MTGPRELHPCGHCGRSGRDLDVRMFLVNLAREAVLDHRPYTGVMVDHQYRCAPCREAVRLRKPLPRHEEGPPVTTDAFTTEAWSTTRRSIARLSFTERRAECRALQIESTPKGQKVRVFMEPNAETGAAWQRLTIQLPDGATVEIRGSDWYLVDVHRPDGSLAGFASTDPEEDPS